MPDLRSDFQKSVWDTVGPPLYYCSECLLAVKVKVVAPGVEPIITRNCGKEGCSAQIIAPRKAIAAGEGGLSLKDQAVSFWQRFAAAVTGRCV